MKICLTFVHVLMCAVSLFVSGGCGNDYPCIPPEEVRAFKIAVDGPELIADSTLCLFSVPIGYTPDRSFPLVVALHGGGSSAALFHDLWRPVTQAKGYVLATPQGEQPASGGIGYRWGPNAEKTIQRSIDVVLKKANVNRSKIYLSGFSQGGHLTYALAQSYPHVFAGIAPIGVGYDLPDSAETSSLCDMRIYIGHGEREPGLKDVRRLTASLRAQGCSVRLAVYRDTGHGIPQPVSSELERVLDYLETAD